MLNKNEKETCTEKVTTEKSQLFMHVGKYEENFIKAYEHVIALCMQLPKSYNILIILNMVITMNIPHVKSVKLKLSKSD
jgi:hypothetical protein